MENGTVLIQNKGRKTTLDPSDDQKNFPSTDGWYKTDRVHRPTTWEYVRLTKDGSLEIQHFCTDYCHSTYKGLSHYCCSGSGKKKLDLGRYTNFIIWVLVVPGFISCG